MNNKTNELKLSWDKKISRVDLAVRNYIYHSLNDVVIEECGQRLPVPYTYFMEWWIKNLPLLRPLTREIRESENVSGD